MIKENENRGKYFELARDQKELLNMNDTMIPIVSLALGTIPRGLVKRIENLESRG